MKKKVYIETSVVSYLSARPSRDIVLEGHRQLTVEWWTAHRQRFDLHISDVVLREAAHGDHSAAARRLAALDGLPVLVTDARSDALARLFIDRSVIPAKAADDAFHVALATIQEIDFLLTWNCTHIANAEMIKRMEAVCLESGYKMPILCTPYQWMGE